MTPSHPTTGVASPKAFGKKFLTPCQKKWYLSHLINYFTPIMILTFRRLFLIFLISGFCFMLVSCTATPTNKIPRNTQKVINQAQSKGWQAARYPINNSFIISTYEFLPAASSEKIIHAYIEGDGNSWESKYKLSKNPTPKHPLTLQLALRDPHPLIVYLARPCQYTPHHLDKKCDSQYWSSHRYAPEVVGAMNETLNQIKRKQGNQKFILVGYSGGAAIATLIAANRQDVQKLITVAGDLDHKILNEYHQTTPLTGSLNPIRIAHKLKKLPQYHWSGKRDKVVPPWMAAHFSKTVDSPLSQHYVLAKATHHQGWVEAWPQILRDTLSHA